MPYPFLSPEWIVAMRELRTEYAEHDREVQFDLAANITVTEPPFGNGSILGHIDTTGPALTIEEGHLDNADFGIEVPWEVAKQLFVDRDPALVMPALMGGKVKLTGDSSKVLAFAALLAPQPGQSLSVPDDAEVDVDVVKGLVARIDEITEK
ncbi:MAG: hypothetical protein CL416_05465 [Acidimicrobiaceae bacterium]|nr:hypothetical protein [Acidimicrobiaceae bacterium]